MAITISYQPKTTIPVEVEGVTPCACRELSLHEIQKLTIYIGNEEQQFGDVFDVSGSASDESWTWQGDLSGVHWLGANMTSGSIRVEGSIGRHLGSTMSGGDITVTGDASDWVGAEMQGGQILVQGRAGHQVGAAYRGSPVGMSGGAILIQGAAGNEIGHTMRRGLIAIGGNAGDLIGFNMLAGTILVFGDAGIRHGAGMTRGTIGLLGTPVEMLPTFRAGVTFRPPMLPMLFQRLKAGGFAIPESFDADALRIYHGDLLEGGRGEIFMTA